MRMITDALECYGYWRVTAELRHCGHAASDKKFRRLMRARPEPAETTAFHHTADSDHDGPIYPYSRARLPGPRP